MTTSPRIRAAIAAGALVTTAGLGLVATPFLAVASASTVDSTPTTTIFKDDYEAAHPGDANAWGEGMSDPSTAFCDGAEATSIGFSGSTTAALESSVGTVVIHAGQYVFIWTPGTAGVQYQTPEVSINDNRISQAISWAVVCGGGSSSSAAPTGSSTPTPTESSTATSTPSTSSTPTETTSATSTPTDPATGTATETASETSSADASGTADPGSLAHTGGGAVGLLLALGVALVAAGAVVLGLGRKAGSHA